MIQPTCITAPAQASSSSRRTTLVMLLGLPRASGVLAGRVAIIGRIVYILRLASAAPRLTLRQCAAPSSVRVSRTAHRDVLPAELSARRRAVRSAHGPDWAGPERGCRTRGMDRGQ